MFKVKATVISFSGDEEKYPCHFGYKLGDEIIFDGEKLIGRICTQILPLLGKYIPLLHSAGPRYIEPMYYYPFWYAPPNTRDPSMKKYDGIGFKIVKENIVEPQYTLGSMSPPTAFKYPPHGKRDIKMDVTARCDDLRTGVNFKFEAFDISDKGDAIPYFRKQMVILSKLLPKPGIKVDQIRNEFSEAQLDEIYPGLYPVLMEVLIEDLGLMGYLDIQNCRVSVTKKGEKKLSDFIASITAEEREALEIQ